MSISCPQDLGIERRNSDLEFLQPAWVLTFVCALHEQSTPAESSRKSLKIQNYFFLAKKRVYFSRGCKSLMRGVVREALASRKVVCREACTEATETAKVCTDEQEEPEGATLWHRFGAYEAYLSG